MHNRTFLIYSTNLHWNKNIKRRVQKGVFDKIQLITGVFVIIVYKIL